MSKSEEVKTNYEEKAGEVTKFDKLLKEASLGYYKARIWGPDEIPGTWGAVNDREIKDPRKGTMQKSYKTEGIQRCRVDTVIKMAMKRSWLNGSGVPDIEGRSIDEVPELELTEAGKEAGAAGLLKPLEGLGRRGGIEYVYKELEASLNAARAKVTKIDGMKNISTQAKDEKLVLGLEIIELRQQLEMCTYWTFRIIDGELVEERLGGEAKQAYVRWSKNESRAMKPEDEDEKVVQWVRSLTHYGQADEAEYQERLANDPDTLRMTAQYDKQLGVVRKAATGAGTKYSAVFTSPHCVKYLERLLTMPLHFRHSKLLKLSGLSRMTEGGGGLIAKWVQLAQERMCVWANGDESVSSADIKAALAAKKYEELMKFRDSTKREHRGAISTIDGVLCRELDDLFRTNFFKSRKTKQATLSEHFMGTGEAARALWNAYSESVTNALRIAQSKGGLPRGFTARAFLDLIWLPGTPQPMPFLTESIIEAWYINITSVMDATNEIISWIDPLAHWSSLATSGHKNRDTSAALFSTIEKEPMFSPDDAMIVSDMVGHLLYEITRTDLVNLQHALHKADMIAGKRPKDDKGWKMLFPDGLDAKNPVTEPKVTKAFKLARGERAEYNPMHLKGMTDVDIYKAVLALFPTLSQSRSKMDLDRRASDSSVRALVVTSSPYTAASSNRVRDWVNICAWAVAEFAFVKQYRQDLLLGPAGAIRLMLSDIFDRYAIPAAQSQIVRGVLVQDKKFAWCDMLTVVNADAVLEQTRGIDSAAAASNLTQQQNIRQMQNDIQRLVTMWESSPYARNDKGPSGSVDRQVASILTGLVEATEINAARNRHRLYHIGEKPAPTFDTRNTEHFKAKYARAKTYRDRNTSFAHPDDESVPDSDEEKVESPEEEEEEEEEDLDTEKRATSQEVEEEEEGAGEEDHRSQGSVLGEADDIRPLDVADDSRPSSPTRSEKSRDDMVGDGIIPPPQHITRPSTPTRRSKRNNEHLSPHATEAPKRGRGTVGRGAGGRGRRGTSGSRGGGGQGRILRDGD